MKFKLIENKIRLDEKQWVPVEIQHPFKSYSFKTRFYVPDKYKADKQLAYVKKIIDNLTSNHSSSTGGMKFANELLDYLRSDKLIAANPKAQEGINYDIKLLDSDDNLDLSSAVVQDRRLRDEAHNVARKALTASNISTDHFFVHHINENESDQSIENILICDLSQLLLRESDRKAQIDVVHKLMHLFDIGKASESLDSVSIPIYEIVNEDGVNKAKAAYEITCSIKPL